MSKHSRERASQRYNLNLSYADEKNIIEQLKQGKGIPLNIDSGEKNKKFAYVVFNNIPLKVLYERSNAKGIKNIITIYPESPRTPFQRLLAGFFYDRAPF